jgi:transcriptional regulator with XRE-family HTH domain
MPIERRPKEYVEAAGKRLRQARLSLGFSQKDFCQLLDVKTGIYSAWENGRYLIDPFIASKISIDYNIPMDFIYNGKKDNLPTKLRDYLFS